MLKVALDFDSVLADTMTAWVKIYNKKHNKFITKSDIKSWDFHSGLGISEKEMYDIFQICWSEWENLPPTEENIADTVKEIRKISLVEIVTSAKFSFIESIRLWLNKTGITSIKIINKSEKADLDYDLFIDDSPITALSISKIGKICLLYDQPWNRNIIHNNNIIRIKSLFEATSYIKNKKLT